MPAYFLEIFTLTFGILLLMYEAFVDPKSKSNIAVACLIGLVAAYVMIFFCMSPDPGSDQASWSFWTRFYTIEGNALFYKGLILITAASVILLTIDYKKILSRFTDTPDTEDNTGEFYPLILIATTGMMWMVSAKDLVSVFVALELTTITFYILVAYMRRNVGSLEAGVKYLILGALSTGILVYGIAWVYGIAGTTSIAGIGEFLSTQDTPSYGLLFGLALLLLSIGFKVGAAPMQLWIPDVYQGAPTPTTAFLSVASKASGFAIAVIILTPFLENDVTHGAASMMLTVMACLTLIIGNLSAINQSNFKRLLAYSSIAHAGFITIALAAWNGTATEGSPTSSSVIGFYLATYMIMTMAAFFLLAAVRKTEGHEELSAFNGLSKRAPVLTICTTVLLAAMAGLPLTAGFWGKLFVVKMAVDAAQAGNPAMWWVIGIVFIAVGAGFYYYFKLIAAMYWNKPASDKPLEASHITKAYLITAAVVTLILGIYPAPLMWLLQ